jgi:ABC-type transporter Mla subunit MlaD
MVCVPAVLFETSASAGDSHSYRIELDNAFGLVHGSDVRIAGVNAGTVSELSIDPAKRAVVTVNVSGPLSQLRADATCSSQPQSLIAEYFLDCQPGHSPKLLPDGGLIPVSQTHTNVQNDLVLATMREPFKERLALIIDEFGTALAGNPQNLNAAIRRGAPALGALRGALAILARQNRTIRGLNVNSDQIISRLAQRRQDVVNFVANANRTAQASAQRGADLSRDFQLLPGFLTALRPNLARLGDLAQQQTPLLVDLNASAGQLDRLTKTLPAFNDSSTPALETLGGAAHIGRQAFSRPDVISALRQASRQSYAAADPLANFLVDLDDPARATETDTRATTDTGRPQPTGYTGMESLLNYVYYQTAAINQFDQVGHLLQVVVQEFMTGPCDQFNSTQTVPTASDTAPPGQPGYVGTTNVNDRNRCVSWLGPHQPGINAGPQLPPYSGSVCPQGSTDLSLCNPANPRQANNSRRPTPPAVGGPAATPPTPSTPGGAGGQPGLPQAPNLPTLPNLPQAPKLPHVPKPPSLPVPGGLGGLLGGQQENGGGLGGALGGDGQRSGGATNDLLNFLFGA